MDSAVTPATGCLDWAEVLGLDEANGTPAILPWVFNRWWWVVIIPNSCLPQDSDDDAGAFDWGGFDGAYDCLVHQDSCGYSGALSF